MRDIALLLYFYFSDKPQRALETAFISRCDWYGYIELDVSARFNCTFRFCSYTAIASSRADVDLHLPPLAYTF